MHWAVIFMHRWKLAVLFSAGWNFFLLMLTPEFFISLCGKIRAVALKRIWNDYYVTLAPESYRESGKTSPGMHNIHITLAGWWKRIAVALTLTRLSKTNNDASIPIFIRKKIHKAPIMGCRNR
jgi:hypothetical protein